MFPLTGLVQLVNANYVKEENSTEECTIKYNTKDGDKEETTILKVEINERTINDKIYSMLIMNSDQPFPSNSYITNFTLTCNYDLVCTSDNPDCFTNKSVRFFFFIDKYDSEHIIDSNNINRSLVIFSNYLGSDINNGSINAALDGV